MSYLKCGLCLQDLEVIKPAFGIAYIGVQIGNNVHSSALKKVSMAINNACVSV